MMALGLLFLTVLATLVSCRDPEGNGGLGDEGGLWGAPELLAPVLAQSGSSPRLGTGGAGAEV